jgi:hypothetical protein
MYERVPLFEDLVTVDRLCGPVVRVLGYRSGGPGSIPGTTRKNKIFFPTDFLGGKKENK